ncbi:MAG: hypothetical protein J6V22_06375, partial [Clostridia bacterium]|nr:hypothetical protein [Clostridia bacterium]
LQKITPFSSKKTAQTFIKPIKGGCSMKKAVVFFILFFVLIGNFTLPVNAQATRCQWYCKHVKGHAQPNIDKNLTFVEDYQAYYIDRRNTDPDAEEKVIY